MSKFVRPVKNLPIKNKNLPFILVILLKRVAKKISSSHKLARLLLCALKLPQTDLISVKIQFNPYMNSSEIFCGKQEVWNPDPTNALGILPLISVEPLSHPRF